MEIMWKWVADWGAEGGIQHSEYGKCHLHPFFWEYVHIPMQNWQQLLLLHLYSHVSGMSLRSIEYAMDLRLAGVYKFQHWHTKQQDVRAPVEILTMDHNCNVTGSSKEIWGHMRYSCIIFRVFWCPWSILDGDDTLLRCLCFHPSDRHSKYDRGQHRYVGRVNTPEVVHFLVWLARQVVHLV